MRPVFALALFGSTVGCAAPEFYPLADFEVAEKRFQAQPSDRARIDDILKKDQLTLADALEIADRLNPQLEIERKNIDLATAALWEAKLYPNPSAILELEDYRTDDSFGDAKRTAGLSLPIVVSGRIGAATGVAEKEREVAAIHYVWRRREILSEVKRAYVALLASRRNLELARQTRDIAKTLHDVTNERFKAQAVPEMELLKAAVNLAKAEADVKLAERDSIVSLKGLQTLMGDADFPKDRFVGDLATRYVLPALETLRGEVLLRHPLIEEATRAREAAELQLSLARVERIPDLALSLTGGVDGENDTILQAGLEIPLPLFNRNQGRVAQAETRIQQSTLQLQAVRNDLIRALTEAHRTLAASQDRVTTYADEILPKAQKALEQTDEGHKLGKFGYLDVLDAQRTLAEARAAFVAALSDLNLAAVELEKLTGTKLETLR